MHAELTVISASRVALRSIRHRASRSIHRAPLHLQPRGDLDGSAHTMAARRPWDNRAAFTAKKAKLDRTALLREVFAAVDKDKNGTIDVAELKRTAKSKNEAEQEMPMLFHFFDDNSDGKLTFDEFCAGMAMIGGSDDAAFEKEMKDVIQMLWSKSLVQ